MAKATFTVGVFGLACHIGEDGKLRIKVNVRTDQERQRALAKLPPDWPGKIIDMPGGGVDLEDFPDPKAASLLEVLSREIAEETGCTTEPLASDFRGPVMVVTNISDAAKPCGDLAFWIPILLRGHPVPTAEAADHPWITQEQLDAETEYRPVGGLGKAGRTGRMLRAAFAFYEAHRDDPHYFSVPE